MIINLTKLISMYLSEYQQIKECPSKITNKKGYPFEVAFKCTSLKLCVSFSWNASANQVTISISGVDARNRRPKLIRLHISQREYRFLA